MSGQRPKKRNKDVFIIGGVAIAAIAVVAAVAIGVLAFAHHDIKLDEATVSDAQIREALTAFDANKDGMLSNEEAAEIQELELTGVQKGCDVLWILPNLTRLTIQPSSGSDIDLSGADSLREIYISHADRGTRINVSQLPNVCALSLTQSDQTTLDTSGDENLETIDLTGSTVDSVDVTDNPKIVTVVNPGNTAISGLDKTELKQYFVPVEVTYQTSNKGTFTQTATYDEENRLSVVTDTNSEGSFATTYTYDGKGQITSIVQQRPTNTAATPATWAFEYDGAGRITHAESSYASSYDPTQAIYGDVWSYQYGSDGALSEYNHAAKQGGGSPIYAQHDSAGNVTFFTLTYAKSASDGEQVNYDAQGRITGTTAVGSCTEHSEVTYNDAGQCSKIVTNGSVSNGGVSSQTTHTYAYDANGRMTSANTSTSTSSTSGSYGITGMTYDDYGNMVSCTYKSSSKSAMGNVNVTVKYKSIVAKPDQAPVGLLIDFSSPYSLARALSGSSTSYTPNFYGGYENIENLVFNAKGNILNFTGYPQRMTKYATKQETTAVDTATKAANYSYQNAAIEDAFTYFTVNSDQANANVDALNAQISSDINTAYGMKYSESEKYPNGDRYTDYKIYPTYFQDGVVGVCHSYYSYLGGAHGTAFVKGYVYDLNSGTKQTPEEYVGLSSDVALQYKTNAVSAFLATVSGGNWNTVSSAMKDVDSMGTTLTPDGVALFIPAGILGIVANGPQTLLICDLQGNPIATGQTYAINQV